MAELESAAVFGLIGVAVTERFPMGVLKIEKDVELESGVILGAAVVLISTGRVLEAAVELPSTAKVLELDADGVLEGVAMLLSAASVLELLDAAAAVLRAVDTGKVLDGALQSKPTLWIPTEQLDFLTPFGSWNVTDLAPPHCELATVDPEAEQEAVCLQVEPSAMP
ncbi:hypothetical protein MMC24_007134 [Lignoscripta atroalba]|nr:hypothetical protein [Lignoscripta atroalba]